MTGRSRIAVIGAGAIGGRHVQAMAGVTRPVDLDIVDPLPEARQRAIALLAESGGLSNGTVRELSGIDELDTAPDLAIVATASRERPQVVQEIVGRGARALILEKVLFTRLADYDAVDHLFAREGVKAWVNCPLRSYPQASRLAALVGSTPFSYRVEGEGWGLACNLVHHLDEFAGLSACADISLDTSALDCAIAPAKRGDYIEFFGTISGTDRAGNRFSAHCGSGPARGRTVSIESGDKQLTILPRHELVIANGVGSRTEPYPMPPQSKMTAIYAEAILAGGSPGLPDYAASSHLHRTMLEAFIGHLRRVRKDNGIDECPVT